jgi:predicted MFS family arabinose efflux permease
MKTAFYRSLDRTINIFGLRGGWVRIYLIALGCSTVLALFIGIFAGTSMGFAFFIIMLIGLFFLCLVLQTKLPDRQLPKARVQPRMRQAVIRRETLSRILLDPPQELKIKE